MSTKITPNGKIYKAVISVMEEVGAIKKNHKNPMQGYQFRGIDDAYNALQPALMRHGVFITPEVIDKQREERETKKGGVLIYTVLTIKFTFHADDGSYVEATTIGEAMDSSDKSANKAMSAAYKYAIFQVFCIPVSETGGGAIDSEKDHYEPAPKASGKMTKVQSDSIFKAGRKCNLSESEVITLVKWKADQEKLNPKGKEICDYFIGKTEDGEWKMQVVIDNYNDFLNAQQIKEAAQEVFNA